MKEQFKGINETEYQQLIHSIADVTILIAGADGKIDDNETKWANKLTEIRSYKLPSALGDFYKEVGIDFQNQIDKLVVDYRNDKEGTLSIIKFRLANLNDVLVKIENKTLAYELYQSLLSFAKHVARATGGILGWGAINAKEDEVVHLDMIHKIEPPIED